MKKILVPLLMTVLCLSLVACNASEPAQSEGSTSIPAASQNTENLPFGNYAKQRDYNYIGNGRK